MKLPTDTGAYVTTNVQFAAGANVALHVPPVPGYAPLLKANGKETINTLCALVFDVNRIKNGTLDVDTSFGWRPTIEQSDANWPRDDVADLLVDALRDAIDNGIRADALGIDDVKELLASRGLHTIFGRFLIHVARTFADRFPEFAEEQLLHTDSMHSLDLRHEYSLLLKYTFKALTQDKRDQILAVITAGPDSRNWDLDNEEQRQDFESFARAWKRDRLAMIVDHLGEDWKSIYANLVETLGPPNDPEASSSRGVVWVGPVSPKPSEDLATMSTDALVEYLILWRPSKSYMSPSPEGLGRALQEMAAKAADKLLASQEKLRRVHPAYVRSIIAGIAEAAKAGREIKSNEALELALWASRQQALPYLLPGQFTDKDWSWTRRATIDLVIALMATRTGLVQKKPDLPISYRSKTWDILEVALADPDPVPEAKGTDADLEPSSLALNSVRGAAMHALVDYALWIRRWQESQTDAQKYISAGLDSMPEVRRALDEHLDLGRDPSLAIRSVYGQWFPWLVMLDSKWASSAVGRIFPLEASQALMFEASWSSYVSFNQAYNDAAGILEAQYLAAANRLGEGPSIRVRALRSTGVALGEHLLTLYGRGQIPLENEAIDAFFKHADSETREGALTFVGRTLMPQKGDAAGQVGVAVSIPQDVILRFTRLWASRVDLPGFADEAPAFGWWFASSQFDDRWALENLIRAAKATSSLQGLYFSLDRLILLAKKEPLLAVNFLQILITQHDRQIRMFEIKDAFRPMLESILGAGGEPRAVGIRLVNRLAETGVADYGDLLKKG